MNKVFAIAFATIVSFLLAACSGNKQPQAQDSVSSQPQGNPQQVQTAPPQRAPAAPMKLVMHCVTVQPPMPMNDPDFKNWVKKTMSAGKWCTEEKVALTIVTSEGRTAKKEIHLIGGEFIETIPSDVVAEYPLTITVQPSQGAPVSMRIGAPVPGRAILMVSEKKRLFF